jgi:hypothetical protein
MHARISSPPRRGQESETAVPGHSCEASDAGARETLIAPPASWAAAALEAVPSSARRVLVLSVASHEPVAQESGATADGQTASESRVVWRTVARGGVAAAVSGEGDWDGLVLGPGVFEPRAAGEIAGALSEVTGAIATGGRLVVVAGGGECASDLERALLELGYAIRSRAPVDETGVTTATGSATPLQLFSAKLDGHRVRAARDGDEPAILDLFARSFHTARSLEHWRWKYRENPYGNGRISLAFAPDGELVGQYCAYPVRLYRKGVGSVEIQQVGDTMTARAARAVGRGPTSVLARAARHFYVSFCDGRVAFNYGFNTGNIQQFGNRFLGVHRVADAPYREADPFQLPPPPGLLRRLLRSCSVREIRAPEDFDRRFDELFADCRDAYGAMVERDSRYLRWRYAERPDLRYQILVAERRGRLVGWAVFSRRDDTLVWGDALFRPDHSDTAGLVLAAASASPDREPARRIVAWFPAHPGWWDEALRRLGFVHRPEPQQLALGVAPFLDADAPRWTAETLYYTYGDSDLF